jgi:hypothetical protein
MSCCTSASITATVDEREAVARFSVSDVLGDGTSDAIRKEEADRMAE